MRNADIQYGAQKTKRNVCLFLIMHRVEYPTNFIIIDPITKILFPRFRLQASKAFICGRTALTVDIGARRLAL